MFLTLWILSLVGLNVVYSHQLHFVGKPNDDLEPLDLKESMNALPSILLTSHGISLSQHKLKEINNPQITTMINSLVHDSFNPKRVYWSLFIAGVSGYNQTFVNSKDYNTLFMVELDSNSESNSVDLNGVLTLNDKHIVDYDKTPNNTHIGTIITDNLYNSSNIFLGSMDIKLLLSLTPVHLPIVPMGEGFYSGTMNVVKSLKEDDFEIKTDPSIEFDIAEQDVDFLTDEVPGMEFFNELQTLSNFLTVLENGGPEMLNRNGIKKPVNDIIGFGLSSIQKIERKYGKTSEHYEKATDILFKCVLPTIISRIGAMYDNDGLGMLVFINEVSPLSPTLENRFSQFLSAYSKKPNINSPSYHSSYNSCVKETKSCFGHGICEPTIYKNNTLGGDVASWQCVCDFGYSGSACQYEDISLPFFTILFICLILVITLSLVVYLICKIKTQDFVDINLQSALDKED